MFPPSFRSLSASPKEVSPPPERVGDGPSPTPVSRPGLRASNPCLTLALLFVDWLPCHKPARLPRPRSGGGPLCAEDGPGHSWLGAGELGIQVPPGSSDRLPQAPSMLCASHRPSQGPPSGPELQRRCPLFATSLPITFEARWHLPLSPHPSMAGSTTPVPSLQRRKLRLREMQDAPWSHHGCELELGLEPWASDSTFIGSALLGALPRRQKRVT